MRKGKPALDLIGKKFDKLIVICRLPNKRTDDNHIRSYWSCLCDCGKETSVVGSKLVNGHTRSCGCLNADRRLGGDEAAINSVYAGYKFRAKDRGLSFEISKEFLVSVSQLDCFYCKSAPEGKRHPHKERGVGEPFIYNGLDRVDNNLGYIESNIVPCCKYCNLMKRNTPLEEFFNKIKAIYEKHLLGEKNERKD